MDKRLLRNAHYMSIISFKSASSFTAKLIRLISSRSQKGDDPNATDLEANDASVDDLADTDSIPSLNPSTTHPYIERTRDRAAARAKKQRANFRPSPPDELTHAILTSAPDDSKLMKRFLKDSSHQIHHGKRPQRFFRVHRGS